MKPVLFAALAALGLAAFAPPAVAAEAGPRVQLAQFGGGYYEERQPRVYRERRIYRDYDDEEFEPRPRRRYYEERGGYDPRPQRGAGLGQTCLTSRGACRVYPQPISSRCTCEIPGFGTKRGAVSR